QTHIFDLFMQADKSPDRARGGLGIGLTLVRRLIEMHGGSVKASSQGPGQGSQFEVRVPIIRGANVPAVTPLAGPEEPEVMPSPAGGRRPNGSGAMRSASICTSSNRSNRPR